MQIKVQFSNKLISLVILSSFLTACGGGSGSNTSNNNSFTPKNVSGLAIDPYLKNANVTFEDCPGKPTIKTNANGVFNFTTSENCQSSAFFVSGGIDVATNLPFTGKLKFQKSNLQASSNLTITPLTTIQAILTESNQQNLLPSVLTTLGINTNTNLSNYDYLKSESSQISTRVFLVQQVINQLGDILQTTGLTEDQALGAVITGLATTISNSPNVNLFKDRTSVNTDILGQVIDKSIANAQLINPNTVVDNSIKANLKNKVDVLSTALNQSLINNPNTSIQDIIINNSDVINAILKSPSYNNISVSGYSLDAIRASSITQPLPISYSNLGESLNLSFSLSNINSDQIFKDNAKVAFLIEGTRGNYKENLNVIITNIAYNFNANGQLKTAIIPKGTEIKITSTLKDVTSATFNINKDININSNGLLSLNSLLNSSTTLSNYYNRYVSSLSKNDLVKNTVYVTPNAYLINPSLDLPIQTVSIGDSSITGSTVTAYFLLQ